MQISSNPWPTPTSQKKRISYESKDDGLLQRQRNRIREMFPFKEPYPQQLESMDEILSCLNQRKNLLLECPTGTGKTLMLLTAAFTYIEANPSKYQILFLTKTNGQVNGLVKELNKIRDADSLTSKYAILAGRSQLCIQKDKFNQFLQSKRIKNTSSKNINKLYELFCTDCKSTLPKGRNRTNQQDPNRILDVSAPIDLSQLIKSESSNPFEYMEKGTPTCENFEIAEMTKEDGYQFNGFSKVKFNKDSSSSQEPRLPDIEDMASLFKSTDSQCPFYFNRYIAKQANLVFMNYNYLLNPDILGYVSKNVIDQNRKSIIIFDEAHNIEQHAESQFQTKLKLSTMKKLIEQLQQIYNIFRLAHTLQVSDIFQETGIALLDKLKEAALKSERRNSKPQSNKAQEQPPYQINLKLEEAAEIENSLSVPVPPQQLSVDSQSIASNTGRQILSELSQNRKNQSQFQSTNQQQKQQTNVEKKSSRVFNCQLKIEECQNQEISSQDSIICVNSQEQSISQAVIVSKTEEGTDNQIEEEKDNNFEEFLETLRENQLDQRANSVEEVNDFDQGLLTQSSTNQDESSSPIKASDRFEQQKKLLNYFFANYEEILSPTIAYIKTLVKFSEARQQKKLRPESHLMSEYRYIKEFYSLFGLFSTENPGKDDPNKENNQRTIKEEETKSILDKVNEMFSSEKQTHSKLQENFDRLNQINEFTSIFTLVIRQVKIKFSKLNQESEIEKYLAQNSFCEGNLHQLKLSLTFFANSLQPLKGIKKIKKVSNFLGQMQSFFDLSMIHQRSLRNNSNWNSYNCFNIESEDLKKLQDYYLSIQINEAKQNLTFTLGCLSGKYAFRSIQSNLDVHSIILCSGTLAPFDILIKNLDTQFKTYSSSHVIDPTKQIFTQFIQKCNKSGELLNFSFARNQMDEIDVQEKNKQNLLSTLFVIKDIVLAITGQGSIQGGGIIVFFKSYDLMHKFQNVFLCSNVHRAFGQIPIYFENQINSEFQIDFASFRKNIQNKKKTCIFFAACRGKLSEGIDLSDDLARSVIIVGMPFWHLNDPYLVSKKKYVQRVLNMDSSEWERKQVIRCVNQAAGRSIRHIKDWGSVFFICQTFAQDKYQTDFKNLIANWVLQGENNSQDFLPAFNTFLDSHNEKKLSSSVLSPIEKPLKIEFLNQNDLSQ